MRQVFGLIQVIHKSEKTEFYNRLLSYGTIHGVKLPSLNEFLSLTSSKGENGPKEFDEETDKFLEAEALKRLHERRKVNG
jgi:hypothetical protein